MFQFNRKEQVVILILGMLCVLTTGMLIYKIKEQQDADEAFKLERGRVLEVAAPAAESQEIMVHVAGCIKKPGVYKLSPDSRVIDAIETAGGAMDNAYLDAVNLAAKVHDEQRIYIPKKGETVNCDMETINNAKININTAEKKQLETLPHIGPALAEKIINYRIQQGMFRDIKEIKNVPGIGEKRFQDIKDLICIN